MRTLFKKGSALITALAFLFASTNLVLELGIILCLLMGWQFMMGEWVGGLVLIAVMSVLVRLTYPKRLVEEARTHEEAAGGHNHMSMTVEGDTLGRRLTNRQTRIRVAQNFTMEWSMLWKDLAIGFLEPFPIGLGRFGRTATPVATDTPCTLSRAGCGLVELPSFRGAAGEPGPGGTRRKRAIQSRCWCKALPRRRVWIPGSAARFRDDAEMRKRRLRTCLQRKMKIARFATLSLHGDGTCASSGSGSAIVPVPTRSGTALVGGFLSTFVPDTIWKALFLTDASPWLKVPANALLGPLIAVATFVCSIGNVPLAAVLWGGGASFGGVLAFLYADLIVLPLLDTYRRYFGWRMAAYIAAVFYATMVVASLVMDLTSTRLGLVPGHDANVRAHLTHFSLNYTFWLNLAFGTLGVYLWWVSRKHPMQHHGHASHDHARHGGAEHEHAHHHG